tara:strand:- start:226 stop:438 length:213 start_codon:yes stop_codon:yes gene_type:complete
MRGYNPALVAYKAMDIENVTLDAEKKQPISGLLAPKKRMMPKETDKDIPMMRVAKHMKILRQQREQLNDS